MDYSKHQLAMPKFTPPKMVMVLLLILWHGSFAHAKLSGSLSEEAIEARLAPSAKEKVEGADAQAARQEAQKAQASGPASIYKANCSVCHQRGIAGAPKWGDKKAWAPRIDQGMDILFHSLKICVN